jgi:ABC-type glycerol-3-phosphate transport system substrate-binding protein
VLLAMLLAASTLLVAGCSGMSMGSAAPGTYVIQVTATGTNTNTVHYQNVTLIITN